MTRPGIETLLALVRGTTDRQKGTRGELRRLASLIGQRNRVDGEIAAIIGRPAHAGHIGEFVAAAIFEIELHESATHKGTDGHFTRGPLAGR